MDTTNSQNNKLTKDKIIYFIQVIMDNWQAAKLPQNAAQSTYFSLLALFPMLLVVANIIPLFPIDIQAVMRTLQGVFPSDIYNIIGPVLSDYLSSASGGILSIGLITSIWSASNLINSLRFVLNGVYNVDNLDENNLLGRILAPFIMLFLILVAGVLGVIFIFGETILNLVENLLNIDMSFLGSFLALRWPVLMIVIFVVFIFIYKMVPNHNLKLKHGIPGAIFATLALLILSELFTIYVQLSGTGDVGSAAIGTFIVLMIYLYFSNMMILLGGLLNSVIYQLKNDKSVRQLRIEEIEEHEERDISEVFSVQGQPILMREIKKVYPHALDRPKR